MTGTGTVKNMIDVATDFSKYPGGRYRGDGKNSGQRFREEHLKPALDKGEVVVKMDGTLGFGSSFLEEAFGGLVREEGFDANLVLSRLKLETENESLRYSVERFIRDARPRGAMKH